MLVIVVVVVVEEDKGLETIRLQTFVFFVLLGRIYSMMMMMIMGKKMKEKRTSKAITEVNVFP